AAPDATPDQVCRRVRRVVASNLSGGKFVTFFYALVDPEAGRLTYTNAGHNAPILMRRDGECERLETGGQALARLFADGELRHGAAVVRPGDRLVLFTDGVSEAQSPEGEQLGEERLVELVREHRAQGASGLAEVLVEEARRFAAGELSDDLTLVVVAFEA
ncbi:MAG: PP2C family protein-serine/threonine phosphatase, partial [Acidobacteriota bacterium]